MRDINEPLRIAYAAALSQISVPVYYNTLPSNKNESSYVIFRSINNNDASTKSTFDTSTTIVVDIFTKANIGNSGLTVDRVADEVLQVLYSGRQSNLSLSRGQIVNTEIANDVTQEPLNIAQFSYMQRTITFRHIIYVEGSSVDNSVVVISDGGIFRINYSATGGENYFTNTLLQGKSIIDVNRDGISCSEILTSGTPVDKECLYTSAQGKITFASNLEPNEKIFVLYQLN